jgi:soluble lytic murein transglycosylase-like protein
MDSNGFGRLSINKPLNPREYYGVAELTKKQLFDERFAVPIAQAAKEHGVEEALIYAVIQTESAFNEDAVSHADAHGLGQIIPSTANYLGVDNPYHIEQNIDGCARYLRELLDTFDGRLNLAVAAYNAGPGAVRKYNYTIPPYRETQNYVVRVTQNLNKFRRQLGK